MDDSPTRIHFDVPHGDAEAHAALMRRLGHPATVCHGPGDDTVCPILEVEGRCPLIDAAHGVVFEFDLDQETHRRILRRYVEMIDTNVPIRVIASPEVYARHHEALAGIDVWTHEPSAGELDGFAALVEAADRYRTATSGE